MKKVLAFVLVLAMVLGSVTMAFAATYSDDAAITNKEAVAVLSAAGILEGDSAGFRPTDGLTRAEGAAIAARMLLGKADAAKLTTVVGPFNDVPATHWAAGYISYCVSQGLLDGYGNGNFGPEDPLTVAQFGKMMLTALGYKSTNEGFTGANWETNVGSVMVKAGLTDGLTLSGSNACSREVAAQVALNTLKADLVEYTGTATTVSTGNATVVVGAGEAKKVAATLNDKDGQCKGAADAVCQFMERYQKDIKLSGTNSDAFGRPGSRDWTFKNVKAFTSKSSSNLIAKYTTKQTKKTIYELLNSVGAYKTNNKVFYHVIVDGVDASTGTAIADIGLGAANSKTSTADWNATGTAVKGIQMEVFYDSTDARASEGAVTVVAYNYYLAQANADYSEKNENVKVTVLSAGAPIANATLEAKDFDVKNVKADDYLVITVAGADVKSVAPANKVTGEVSTYTAGSDVTIDGTKYTVATKAKANTATTGSIAVGTSVTLQLDPNNFVLAVTDATASKQYVYIRALGGLNGSSIESNSDGAAAYFIDGTKKDIKLKSGQVIAAGAWYTYSVNSKDEYTLTAVAGGAGATVAAITASAANYMVPNPVAAAAGVTGVAGNDTTYLVRKTDGTVKVYTGYKTAPGYTTTGATGITVAAVVKDKYDKYVFVDLSAGSSETGAKTSDYVFIYGTGAFSQVYDADGNAYYTYGKTYANGATATSQFTSRTFQGAVDLIAKVTLDSDGRIENGTSVSTSAVVAGFTTVAGITSNSAVYAGGVLTLGADIFELTDDAKAYVVVPADGSLDEIPVAKVDKNLEENETYDVFVVFTDTKNEKAQTFFFVQK